MLGIFDSGLGGLSVLQHVRRRLPQHDVIYLGDQAHVPYGDRSPSELSGFLRDNLGYLERRGADAIVVACNTSCAVALHAGWPTTTAPVLNLIENAADAIAAAGALRIGVLATTVTARSGAYGAALRARIEGVHVEEVAAPALVPLVEAGKLEGPETHAAVAAACAQFSRDLDVLVYGCTHYPLLDRVFADVVGGVKRFDPAVAQADATARIVADRKIPAGEGTVTFATTGEAAAFTAALRAVLGEEHPHVVALSALAA